MKTKITYICETCGYEPEDKDAVLSCEAKHLGLTTTEKREYDHLKKSVRRWSNTVARVSNEQTRDAYGSAVVRLLTFEVKHGLNGKG